MFNKIKKLLGVAKPEVQEVEALEKVNKATTKTNPVTVKPRKSTTQKPKGETKATLGKLTKKDIDDLAKEKFGVELDRRLTKDKMIVAYLAAQKKAK
jgi:hypothetical protein